MQEYLLHIIPGGNFRLGNLELQVFSDRRLRSYTQGLRAAFKGFETASEIVNMKVCIADKSTSTMYFIQC